MRFSLLHKLASYLLALIPVIALALSPEFSLWAAILAFGGIGLSWFFDSVPSRLPRFTVLWNIGTSLFFFWLLFSIWNGESIIIAGAQFLLLVLVNKLFNRRSNRDYLQAYVVSFMLLVVATTTNTSLSYAICFIFYVFIATWTLILFYLRREIEQNYLLQHHQSSLTEPVDMARILDSRRIITGSFLAGTSLISVGMLLGASLLFALFPRIGLGFFLGQKRAGITIAGFREQVELGHHGVVRDNPNVVMRVIFPNQKSPGPLRWRGTSFDHYQDGRWSHSKFLFGRTQVVPPKDRLYLLNAAPGLPWYLTPNFVRQNLLQQEIYLDPLDSDVLFAADRPVAIERPPKSLGLKPSILPRRGPLGEIRNGIRRGAGLHYMAYSSTTMPSPAVLRQAIHIDDSRQSHFLQLPAGLPSRIGDLARRITADKNTIYDQVLAVQTYLQSHYQYTLKLVHDERFEPIDEFLFVTRRGHCEYFASAMAILLRHIGIHTRSVNGFAGGIWNDYGHYIAVRQGDAHSWVEVLFSNVGWVTFDPTPAGGIIAPAQGGISGAFNQLIDAMSMRWFRYVIEYDLRQQISVIRKAHRFLHSLPRASSQWGESFLKRIIVPLLITLALLIVAYILWKKRLVHNVGSKPRRKCTRKTPSPTLAYQRLLKLLARAGFSKPSHLTPGEFLVFLQQRKFGPLALVQEFTHCYYEARYRYRVMSVEQNQKLENLFFRIKNTLREEVKK